MKDKILNSQNFLLSTVLCLSAAGLVFFGNSASDGARHGMMLCANVLLPSVFPFMCLCSIISESGAGAAVSKLLAPFFKILFPGLSDFSYIYIMSLVGGYPFAASSVGPLCDSGRLSQKGAKKLLLFCFAPTPAFCITAVGQGLYGSPAVGFIIYLSCLLSSLLLGTAVCRIKRTDQTAYTDIDPDRSFCEICVWSVNSASRSILTVCATVIFASSLVAAAGEAVKMPVFSSVLVCISETTAAVEYSAKNLPVYATAAIASFGGAVTFLQAAALSGKLFPPLWLFVLLRIVAAGSSAGICAVLLKIMNVPLPVISAQKEGFSAGLCCNPVPAVFLIICALTLLLSVGESQKNIKEKI